MIYKILCLMRVSLLWSRSSYSCYLAYSNPHKIFRSVHLKKDLWYGLEWHGDLGNLKLTILFSWFCHCHICRCVRHMYGYSFQQDGVSSHYSLVVKEWIDQKFSGRRIGRRDPITFSWPNSTTTTRLFSLRLLKEYIIQCWISYKAQLSDRLKFCITEEGTHYERKLSLTINIFDDSTFK